jgi:hypothetical protein
MEMFDASISAGHMEYYCQYATIFNKLVRHRSDEEGRHHVANALDRLVHRPGQDEVFRQPEQSLQLRYRQRLACGMLFGGMASITIVRPKYA